MVPEKIGLKGVTRDGLDYELTIVFDLDIKHAAVSSKDRTGLFMDKPQQIISEDTGKQIRDWCNSGVDPKSVLQQIHHSDTLDQLRALYQRYPEYQKVLSTAFVKRKEELLSTTNSVIVEPENL